MNLKAPQPNQQFWGVRPYGHNYVSDSARVIHDVDVHDAGALRELGCVDIVAPRPAPPPAPPHAPQPVAEAEEDVKNR